MIGLALRIVLYAAGGWIANMGYASFEESSGDLTVNLDDLAVMFGGFATTAGTLIISRWGKARGWKT